MVRNIYTGALALGLLAGCAASRPAAEALHPDLPSRGQESHVAPGLQGRAPTLGNDEFFVAPGLREEVTPMNGQDPWALRTQRPEVVLAFERMGCYGGCPMYRVSVTREGKVEYFGRGNVKERGAREGQVSVSTIDELLRFADQAGFFREPEHIHRSVTDHERVQTFVRFNGQERNVVHDYGELHARESLERLEHLIDSTLGTSKWVGLY